VEHYRQTVSVWDKLVDRPGVRECSIGNIWRYEKVNDGEVKLQRPVFLLEHTVEYVIAISTRYSRNPTCAAIEVVFHHLATRSAV
jgi:hypothetical protein